MCSDGNYETKEYCYYITPNPSSLSKEFKCPRYEIRTVENCPILPVPQYSVPNPLPLPNLSHQEPAPQLIMGTYYKFGDIAVAQVGNCLL